MTADDARSRSGDQLEAMRARAVAGEQRLARVHRLALALSRAITLEEAAAATFEACRDEVGAAAGAVYLLADENDVLEMAGEFGHAPEVAERFRTLAVALDTPLCAAVRGREPGFYASKTASAAAHPGTAQVILASTFEASVALPLCANGVAFGVLGLQYRERHAFDGTDRVTLVTVSELCALAFERARLLTVERRANSAKHELLATLRESEERYMVLFEQAPLPFALTRADDGKVVTVNRAFEKLFEVQRAEITGRGSTELQLVTGEQRAVVERQFEAHGYVRNFECARRTRAGEQIFVSLTLDRVAIGGRDYVLSSIEEITVRKMQEQALARTLAELEAALDAEKQARVEAQAANRAKDEFLATMSHELRTPLNAVLGWVGMLKADRADAERLERGLDVIERNAHAQMRLVSDLLDVSRIVSGKMLLNTESLDWAALVSAAVDVVRPAAEAKGVRLIPEVDVDMGNTVGDADRLQQVVWNLLSNAIKFTPSGGFVSISARRSAGAVKLRVHDTGAGIPAEHLPHVFERFRQVDGMARTHGGLGLGLAIVRYLVEAHGGFVSASSDGVGHGATFTVSLPIQS